MLADAHGYPGGTAVEVFTSWLLDIICKKATHTLCLIPSSTVVIPPDANVEDVPMEGLVSGGAMTEENLRRRRKEMEALLEGMDTDDAEAHIFQYLNGELAKKTDAIVALEERVLKLEEENDRSNTKRGCSRRRTSPTRTDSRCVVLLKLSPSSLE